MIAVDTSTWIAFLEGDGGEDVERSIGRSKTGRF
jgi:hypothetical protein